MKKIYVDLTTEKNCVGLLVHEPVEVISVGTLTHAEPEKYRDSEPALRFRGLGLHFWFGAAPEPELYTVPRTTIFAHDGAGGRFLTTEEDALYYWDGKRVWRICDSLQALPENWRQTMEPTDALKTGGRPWSPPMPWKSTPPAGRRKRFTTSTV